MEAPSRVGHVSSIQFSDTSTLVAKRFILTTSPRHSPGPNIWDMYYYTNVKFAICRLCNPERDGPVLKASMNPAWEQSFCTCLNAGPFDDLKTASHCRIEREPGFAIQQPPTPAINDDDMITMDQKTKFTFNVNGEAEPTLTEEKDQYIASCLTATYNAIHDPAQYQLKAIEIEEESVTKEDKPNVGNAVKGWPCKFHSIF